MKSSMCGCNLPVISNNSKFHFSGQSNVFAMTLSFLPTSSNTQIFQGLFPQTPLFHNYLIRSQTHSFLEQDCLRSTLKQMLKLYFHNHQVEGMVLVETLHKQKWNKLWSAALEMHRAEEHSLLMHRNHRILHLQGIKFEAIKLEREGVEKCDTASYYQIATDISVLSLQQ